MTNNFKQGGLIMFQKKELVTNYDLIIGENSIIKGDLESEGSIRIDGKVIGNIITLGNIVITENAFVHGNITCQNIDLHGHAEGNIKTQGKISLRHSSHLKGDIECRSFNTDDGASYQGNCVINPNESIIIEVDKMIHEPNPTDAINNLIDFKSKIAPETKPEEPTTEEDLNSKQEKQSHS